MNVEYIDRHGSDLSVVNAARVSFDKNSSWAWDVDSNTLCLFEKDEKLIKYLAKHNHWSPFAHAGVTFRVTAPIFVARQLAKHQVGFAWNEVSRRYVNSLPDFYLPENWREAAADKKQGSSDRVQVDSGSFAYKHEKLCGEAVALYEEMIDAGVCAEQARMILPQSMYTQWYWTGSLYAWANMCNLRCKPDTQEETRYIADLISREMAMMYPISWKALTE